MGEEEGGGGPGEEEGGGRQGEEWIGRGAAAAPLLAVGAGLP